MEEMWENVLNYEGHYLISNSGKVFSLKSNLILSPTKVRSGYKMVRLYKGGWSRDYLIHRLVAEVYCNNEENKPVVNHKDGDKTNNYFLNLEWCTDSENQLHAIRTGLRKIRYGVNSYKGKLNLEQIKDIKNLYNQGLTGKEIAKKYNLHFSTIYRIIQGITYSKE